MKKRKKLLYRLEYAGIAVAGALSAFLGQKGRVAVGRMAGKLALTLVPRMKTVARSNMRLAFPEKSEGEVEALLKANAAHTGRLAMEFIATSRLTPSDLGRVISFHRFDRVEKARENGRGVILVTCHSGNWEWMAMSISSVLAVPLSAVGKRIHNPFVNDLVVANRARFKTNPINNRNAARAVLKHLKKNEAVGMLMDQRPSRGEWVSSTFFGQTVATNPGLATLALRSGAPVLFVECRTEGAGYSVTFGEPIPPPPGDSDLDSRILAFTREIDRIIEENVRARPAEWLWMHDRWKLPKGFKP